jgi:hypothetical protein
MAKSDGSDAELLVARRHFVAGWWGLLVFASGGLALEAMHGLKIPQYLDVSNETRRLMWTLAHAHGTLLSVLNLLFAFSLRLFSGTVAGHRTLVSMALLGATVLLPLGFFAGGLFVFGGDPGLGVLAVPFGAVLLLLALLLLARSALAVPTDTGRSSSGGTRR